MKGIEIEFPGVKALDSVDFTLRKGEVHALLGENGAGKSTLIKCLTGVHHMDAGEILLEGRKVKPTSPQAAMDMGISTVYQEINLCPNLTVAENIFVGRQPMRGWQIDWREINRRAGELMARMGLAIDVTRPLSLYSTAVQQMVSIARAVDVKAKILILDEPTSSLDEREVEQLFRVVRGLKAQGLGIIFITHFLDQVFAISDRMTVLRNGRLVGEFRAEGISKLDLVTRMIGKDMDEIFNLKRAAKKANARAILEAAHIGVPGKVEDISLTVNEGELVGFAGLLGSGRTETAEMLFGVNRPARGTVKVNGETVGLRIPLDAINRKMAFCPEDRKRDGVIGDLSVRENICLAVQAKRGFMKPMPLREQQALAERYIRLLSIATPDAEKKVGELSGGNQQKVILARWLATEPDVLILDEPTRGIDVGAKAEIQRLMLEMCERGIAVIFISSELDEIIRCSNRIVVMRDGAKAGEVDGEDCTQADILHIIAGEGGEIA
ncbi:MAG: sugar ABC transporter ATP-binding protein [Eubacteriales bacterium]|nr:sugar ABC transporter ATP-binding protein [Christensenellaceae bacterium]MEA5064998.1 sugar ABC transporter ATP-binding protein [Eubacteriales bacterium]